MTAERCPVCDRVKAVALIGDNRETCQRDLPLDIRTFDMEIDCHRHAVDWRSRAMLAETRLAELHGRLKEGSAFRFHAADGTFRDWLALSPEATP